MSYRLSLLDKSPIPTGAAAADALAGTVTLAVAAERLGYHRFWIAEHHANATLASPAPEVVIAYILARTTRIRVGSGGVMLQHYSPFKVAELFRTLAALGPGRVDLGIGKAPGGLPLATRALQDRFDPARPIEFDSLLADLDSFLRDALPADHRLAGATVTPRPPIAPERLLLGASPESAATAARLGWQFCYAGHFDGDPQAIERALRAYRQGGGRSPLLALYAFADHSRSAAEQHLRPLKLFRVHLPDGRHVNLPSPEAAAEFAAQAGVTDYRIEEKHPHVIAGTGADVRAELDRLADRFGIGEFIIDLPVPDFTPRRQAAALIAEATGPVHSPREEVIPA